MSNVKQVGGDHYSSKYQHWDLCARLRIGYFEGTATKYLVRWRQKGGVQDLRKALTYIQMLRQHAAVLCQGRPRAVWNLDWIRAELEAFFGENPQIGADDRRLIEDIIHWENDYNLRWIEQELLDRVTVALKAEHPLAAVPRTDSNKHTMQAPDCSCPEKDGVVEVCSGYGMPGCKDRRRALAGDENVLAAKAARKLGPGC